VTLVCVCIITVFREPHQVVQEHLKAKQPSLEDTLIKVVSSPTPTPGRALRNLVGRCLVALYTRGETRSLFETMQSFLKIVGDLKAVDKDANKMYAAVV
jgi:HEAT repeat-containing protein 5